MSKLITKLTKEQEDQIPAIRDKWLNKINNKLDKKLAQENIEWLYEFSGYNKPIVWFFSSPCALQVVANIINNKNIRQNIEQNIRQNIWQNIWQNIEQNIRQNIRENIWQNIGENIWQNIGQNIGQNIWQNIGENIGENIGQNIEQNIRQNIGENIGQNIRQNIWQNIGQNIWQNIRQNIRQNIGQNIGQNIWENKFEYYPFSYYINTGDYGWLAYVEYFEKAKLLNYEKQNELAKLINIVNAGVYDSIQFENICLVCENPIKLKRNAQGQLHADGESAVAWADGYECFYLNGISVPEYLAVTPRGKLDIEFWKKETNADVRTEFRKKYGIERMSELGTVIDSYKNYKDLDSKWIESKYTLIDMSKIYNGLDYCPFLDMVNLTTGMRHLEAVKPDCKTIHDAIAFRCSGRKGITIKEIK